MKNLLATLNVDIRNHQNLLDSLEQYVKGDLLEGANAYHCEKCTKGMDCPVLFKIMMVTYNGFGRIIAFICSQNLPSLFPAALRY